MRAIDPAMPFDHRSGKNPGPAEQFQAKASADDVNDGIDGADLMEMDLVRRMAMDFPFRNRNSLKNRNRFLFHPLR